MNVINAKWEIRNIGARTAEIMLDNHDKLSDLESIQSDLDTKFEYICLKSPVANSEFLLGLGSLGYNYIETQIMLKFNKNEFELSKLMQRNVERFKNEISIHKVAGYDEAEETILKIKNSEMFITDRIYLDTNFDRKCSGNRYYNWAMQAYNGGADVYEIYFKGHAIGISIFEASRDGVYKSVLGGIYADSNKVAFLLPVINVLLFKKLMLDGMHTTLTGVSSNNPAVLKVNLSSGYKITGFRYVYIKHNKLV